ncbi:hypothetical protein NUW54_g13041 [Trametes sanguinea]|uniref:Uncharacterized protein n=1 Tax=Trametes sanguinea TaxID=158606 RepID=A0ACC1MR77_9APHY|nr:hypothetical protein NUW54_g13041 [Trametes sanguinea]
MRYVRSETDKVKEAVVYRRRKARCVPRSRSRDPRPPPHWTLTTPLSHTTGRRSSASQPAWTPKKPSTSTPLRRPSSPTNPCGSTASPCTSRIPSPPALLICFELSSRISSHVARPVASPTRTSPHLCCIISSHHCFASLACLLRCKCYPSDDAARRHLYIHTYNYHIPVTH